MLPANFGLIRSTIYLCHYLEHTLNQNHQLQFIASSQQILSSQLFDVRCIDGIDQVIRVVLPLDLKVARSDKMLLPDHPCSDLVRKDAQRWHISDQAVDNLIHLACGYLKFLIMMLLNPSPNHELLSLYEMIEE
jgi:hypothetical protein